MRATACGHRVSEAEWPARLAGPAAGNVNQQVRTNELTRFSIDHFSGEDKKDLKCKEHIDAALKQYWDHEKDDLSLERGSVPDLTQEDDDDSKEESSKIKVTEETAETEEDEDDDNDDDDEDDGTAEEESKEEPAPKVEEKWVCSTGCRRFLSN